MYTPPTGISPSSSPQTIRFIGLDEQYESEVSKLGLKLFELGLLNDEEGNTFMEQFRFFLTEALNDKAISKVKLDRRKFLLTLVETLNELTSGNLQLREAIQWGNTKNPTNTYEGYFGNNRITFTTQRIGLDLPKLNITIFDGNKKLGEFILGADIDRRVNKLDAMRKMPHFDVVDSQGTKWLHRIPTTNIWNSRDGAFNFINRLVDKVVISNLRTNQLEITSRSA